MEIIKKYIETLDQPFISMTKDRLSFLTGIVNKYLIL